LRRCGRSLAAHASGIDTHRDSITRRFERQGSGLLGVSSALSGYLQAWVLRAAVGAVEARSEVSPSSAAPN
jgi:hypothetical protein